MKTFFTPFFIILLLLAGGGQALAEAPTRFPGKLEVKFTEILSADLNYLHDPMNTLNMVARIWKLHLDPNKEIENQKFTGTKPILHLGSIPDVLLKCQSDTVFQWGYSLRDLILLLRLGLKTEDLKYLDLQPGRENHNLFNIHHLGFNFLIDFWFK